MERWRPIAAAASRWLWQQLFRSPARLRWLLAFLRGLPRQVKAGAAVTVVLLLVVGSVLFVRNPSGPFGKIEPLPPNAATLTRIPVLGPGHRYLFFPVSGRVTAGLKYRYVLLTHCGLDYPTGPDFDGSFWDSVDSTQRDKLAKPPADFAAPEDVGYMILVSANTAEFHSSAGGVAQYARRTAALIAAVCN
ncbi:MAG TPA: hypothetical protein VN912_01240 [Candidatus Angelobacter sp.]|nr:hypothetical protein [Candidatus Angelobacter sp.]